MANSGEWTACIRILLVALLATSLDGCKSGASSNNNAPTVAAAASIKIVGSPAPEVVVGDTYIFQPAAQAAPGARLTFSAANLPAWASIDPATGHIAGTPDASQVGSYTNIKVAVTDGVQVATLAAFSILVAQTAPGAVTLSWTAPTQNADATPLVDLIGYHILYGTSASTLSHVITITTPGIARYVVSNLSPGTWYFAIQSINASNVTSNLSPVISTTI
jgi:hypothetical protein